MLHSTTRRTGLGAWLFSDIRIGSRYDEYQEIYATTIHELGHAAHWKLMGNSFFLSNAISDWNMILSHKMVREAWASGVNDQVFALKFPGRKYYTGSCASNSRLRLGKMKGDGYPRILIRDLIDNTNEFNASNNNCDDLNDNVSGFTMNQVFYTLRGTQGSLWGKTSMEKWRDNLMSRRPSERNDLNTYFDPWID